MNHISGINWIHYFNSFFVNCESKWIYPILLWIINCAWIFSFQRKEKFKLQNKIDSKIWFKFNESRIELTEFWINFFFCKLHPLLFKGISDWSSTRSFQLVMPIFSNLITDCQEISYSRNQFSIDFGQFSSIFQNFLYSGFFFSAFFISCCNIFFFFFFTSFWFSWWNSKKYLILIDHKKIDFEIDFPSLILIRNRSTEKKISITNFNYLNKIQMPIRHFSSQRDACNFKLLFCSCWSQVSGD